MHPVFYVSMLYFMVGAIGMTRISAGGKRDQWKKFLVYLLLVHLVLLLILAGGRYFFYFACVLCLLGGYELVKVFPFSQEESGLLPASRLLYFIISTLFLAFAYTGPAGWILYVYLLVFCFDGFSQLCGQLFGKTTFTRISPSKTLEGLAGGVLITLITAMVFPALPLEGATKLWTSLAIIAAAFAGDLLASAYKRFSGVKDFSRLIPGHGGVLDRFDSLLLAGATAFFLERYLL